MTVKCLDLVLATVNAPYGEKLDGAALAHCLKDGSAAKEHAGHMSSFFGEVAPEDQMEFSASAGISKDILIGAAKDFADYSGESYPLVK